ncbi:hypothetical protein COT07_03850 [Candidatus Woesearchaeota archaeon CG07_land_8_20_14_0_80_44_23]|nr:MAG: hypothetical protein COT07_03850 [Candidatus Woesearchaeota archaeon CG07_land_8_20_14_0_80_44_23]
MREKKVLITGATGFIGANLAHRLAKKGKGTVYVTVRKESNLWRINDIKNSLKFINCDLTDYSETEKIVEEIKPDVVYHCAAYGAVYGENDFLKTIQTNLIGTINLINSCIGKGISAFVNLSSSSEYGLKDRPMREDDPLNPNTDYGISKAVTTEYASQIGKLKGMPIITLRLFSPFGYYESKSRLIPSLLLSIIEGREPQLANPGSARDFIFIEDVIDIMIEASLKAGKHAGGVFNVANGRQFTVKEVAELAIKISGKNLKPHFNALPERVYDTNCWVADMKKTFASFNWRPRYSMEKSLEIMLGWLEKNRGLYIQNGK